MNGKYLGGSLIVLGVIGGLAGLTWQHSPPKPKLPDLFLRHGGFRFVDAPSTFVQLRLPPWTGRLQSPAGGRFSISRADADASSSAGHDAACSQWKAPQESLRDESGQTVALICVPPDQRAPLLATHCIGTEHVKCVREEDAQQ